MEDSIVIANHTKKKLKYKIESSAKRGWKLSFEPATGIVPPMSKVNLSNSTLQSLKCPSQKKQGKKVQVKMTLLISQSMDEKINLTINGTLLRKN